MLLVRSVPNYRAVQSCLLHASIFPLKEGKCQRHDTHIGVETVRNVSSEWSCSIMPIVQRESPLLRTIPFDVEKVTKSSAIKSLRTEINKDKAHRQKPPVQRHVSC
eukprot:6483266-Amphidinium_carterae.1